MTREQIIAFCEASEKFVREHPPTAPWTEKQRLYINNLKKGKHMNESIELVQGEDEGLPEFLKRKQEEQQVDAAEVDAPSAEAPAEA